MDLYRTQNIVLRISCSEYRTQNIVLRIIESQEIADETHPFS